MMFKAKAVVLKQYFATLLTFMVQLFVKNRSHG